MNTPPHSLRCSLLGTLLFSAGLVFTLAGCSTYDEHGYSARYPQPVEVASAETYLYYPDYELYYSPARRQYVFYDGRGWIAHREPPRALIRTLRRAPSVQIYLHESPKFHHREVARDYPRNWRNDRRRSGGDWERRRYSRDLDDRRLRAGE
jgi:hypothetical protein